MSVFRTAVLVATMHVGLNGVADAGFVTFTDEASFLAALSGPSFGADSTDLTSSADDVLQTVGDPGQTGAYGVADSFRGHNLLFTSSPNRLVGVGGWFRRLIGGSIHATVDDVLVDTFSPPTSSFGFWGVVFWSGFHSIRFHSEPTNEWVADDFTFQHDTAVVPEPASATLFGMGAFALLGYRVRRRRKVSHTAA